jgi:hypothetical protein
MTPKNYLLHMRNKTCSIGIIALLTAGVLGMLALRKAKQKKISRVVADAGYELAHDIHFPLKINKQGRF